MSGNPTRSLRQVHDDIIGQTEAQRDSHHLRSSSSRHSVLDDRADIRRISQPVTISHKGKSVPLLSVPRRTTAPILRRRDLPRR
jgi:hypothetical protein